MEKERDVGAVTLKIPVGNGGILIHGPDGVPVLVTVAKQFGASVAITVIADRTVEVFRVEQIERRFKLLNVGELRELVTGWIQNAEHWRGVICGRRSRTIRRDRGSVESAEGGRVS